MAKRSSSKALTRYRTRTVVRTRYRARPLARRARRVARAAGIAAGITPMTMAVAGAGAAVVLQSSWYQGIEMESFKKLKESAGNGPVLALAGWALSKTAARRYGHALMALGIGMTAVRFVGTQMGAKAEALGAADESLSLEGVDDELGAEDDLGADDE